MDGVSVKDELIRHGFLGETRSSFEAIPLKAHFEVHIEQGPILDMANSPVATVSGVQASRWFEVKLQGRGSHAGTTPMRFRHDPLAAFGKFAAAIEDIANEHDGLITIGRMHSDTPQSTNCILDNIVFHIDSRHHEDAKIDEMERVMRARLDEIVDKAQGVRVEKFERTNNNAYVKFDPLAVSCVEEACAAYPPLSIISGAGHDS
jgi:acetylornithine deacetylase/succinyl-diaminopimelate desuccinylase-like protein